MQLVYSDSLFKVISSVDAFGVSDLIKFGSKSCCLKTALMLARSCFFDVGVETSLVEHTPK